MKQKMVLAKDLIGVGGLPKTIQGIHKKAKNEGWAKEAVALPGVRGRSFAYAFDNLPEHVQQILSGLKDDFIEYQTDRTARKTANPISLQQRLTMLFSELSEGEMAGLVNLLTRKGVETVLLLLDEQNLQLMRLQTEEKERLLALHKAKKGASSDSQENELTNLTHKQAG